MALLLLLTACWRPDADKLPAELPPLEPAAYTAGGEGGAPAGPGAGADDAEGGAPDAGGDAAEGDAAGADGAAGDPAAPEGPPFEAYPGFLTTAPVTIVDDYGKPLAIVTRAGTAVEVRGEESVRRKVYCASCSPAVEGWVQLHTVTAGGEAAHAAPLPPPALDPKTPGREPAPS